MKNPDIFRQKTSTCTGTCQVVPVHMEEKEAVANMYRYMLNMYRYTPTVANMYRYMLNMYRYTLAVTNMYRYMLNMYRYM